MKRLFLTFIAATFLLTGLAGTTSAQPNLLNPGATIPALPLSPAVPAPAPTIPPLPLPPAVPSPAPTYTPVPLPPVPAPAPTIPALPLPPAVHSPAPVAPAKQLAMSLWIGTEKLDHYNELEITFLDKGVVEVYDPLNGPQLGAYAEKNGEVTLDLGRLILVGRIDGDTFSGRATFRDMSWTFTVRYDRKLEQQKN